MTISRYFHGFTFCLHPFQIRIYNLIRFCDHVPARFVFPCRILNYCVKYNISGWKLRICHEPGFRPGQVGSEIGRKHFGL